jgi:two-component system OmpR family response regulator
MTDSHANPIHQKEPKPLKVLCVDDNEDAADTLGQMLSIVGHEVAIRHDGASALEVVEGGFQPDVAILDISMPGIDGCQLAEALRARRGGKDVLLVALTALGDYGSLERMADSGFDLHFTKPVMPEQLYGVLDERSTRIAASRH